MIGVHSSAVVALKRQDEERRAREARMRNALEILADVHAKTPRDLANLPRLVRAIAREGLGRDDS